MEYNEEDYLLISGIQHFVFCRRQWALIHIEQQWSENVRTIEGGIVHERAHDNAIREKRGQIVISRGLNVFSSKLGVTGTCDVVEFHKSKDGVSIYGEEGLYLPVPVEYKRGKPKEDNSDILQLCAQAMCLEDMMLCDIKSGYLYYDEIKRRTKVEFSQELREEVLSAFEEMHELYNKRYTPKVKISKRCNACSIKDMCIPKLCKNKSVSEYIERYLTEDK